MDENREIQLQNIWLKLGTIPDEEFVHQIKNYIDLLTDSQTFADIEDHCKNDSQK
ncbi:MULTISPECIES: hypothetical protein [Chryseobacterium]|uniref:Uncharacterized protein n=1 Tax=Chryseobacterium camelliae TaxID=1265445 RepID=A0ABU0TGR2_9FLAO|nr:MULTISPECIES: hypothetical protein [Chryseobacterium]MDT3406753.1 hypothetical protein [Pseudacidovorax intermedius]MDQ1095450.1 hypothetical protein [Chryseobacterium camelliae]MDQ1099390.1 hypothetical protein [Chryseobacterium sp. SORGH_AS_1048]MDR6086736.1 hypothetical protein [Chryseobacterium sp. SORGH_AS_0909]MDR6131108.1 hypothetical protein [Chryseobacterium sp. SORGH_AS_1175]